MDAVIAVTDKAEQVFDGLGLGDGTFAPIGRFAFGWAVGTGVMEIVRPAVAYNGLQRRPWAITSPNDNAKTFIPWWAPGIATGILAGVFI